ncbi:hypothetical protein ACI3LY_000720 [Candidozyma auris]|uniref:Protein GVP36 n=2 Tax=Candidozyma auris TaxID=498019 RepID=A0A2H1A7M7_CANAR|nr:hypothetical protein B9J08_000334 [[Candida] auris]QWW23179.1 hypothetical protein CA7LBN_001980 [[Candida] auris]
MSFFKSIQESLPKVDLDNITKSFQNGGKAVSEYSESLKESIQPFTQKTQSLISTQLHQVQQLAQTHIGSNIEVSELPSDYLDLEKNCDVLLKLYTDLIQFTNDTYGVVSYDYPPGNTAISKIRDANVGGLLSNKFNQLKNVSTPQEMEKVLLGQSEDKQQQFQEGDDTVEIQTVSAQLPKTLYGQLAAIANKYSEEFKESSNTLSFALLKISSSYTEIGTSRLEQDRKVMAQLNHALVAILNEQFIKVNELRKRVYSARSEFDLARSKKTNEQDEEDEELIAKEDELVSATEVAVLEMRKLLKPSKNVDLLKIFVKVQKDHLETSAKKLASLLSELDKIEFKDEDDE